MIVFNTINKFKKRPIKNLQGLKMDILQNSFKSYITSVIITNTCVDTSNFNTFSKLKRRNYIELFGLKISIIENSYRKYIVKSSLKIVRPNKIYKAKLILIKKYGRFEIKNIKKYEKLNMLILKNYELNITLNKNAKTNITIFKRYENQNCKLFLKNKINMKQ